MLHIKNEHGFSLVEVIASIALISIILLSFFQIFIQTNKTAVSNNEKLVVINLADAELERLKIDPFTETLQKPVNGVYNNAIVVPKQTVELNNKIYVVSVRAKQSIEEKNLKLIDIVVTVTAPNEKTKSSVEGYVSYD